jgi:hypothetical protein
MSPWAIVPFKNEPKMAIATRDEILIVALDVTAFARKKE